jgi:hypothetical protein
MHAITKLIFNEFAASIIDKFELKTTTEELYGMWREKVKAIKVTVSFNDEPVKSIPAKDIEEDGDEPAVEVAKTKKTETKAAPLSKEEKKKSPSTTTCPYKSVRGENKGQVCGKNSTKDSIMCSSHKKHADKYCKVSSDEESADEAPAAPSNTQKKTCTYVLTRGDKKGSACGAGATPGTEYCSKHSDKKEKKADAVPKAKGSEPSADAAPAKIMAAKDTSGRLVLKGDRKLVIKSTSEMVMIGKVVGDKTVPLSDEDIEFCKKSRLRYEVALSKKNIEDVIDEITGAADDQEDEDVEHDDEIVGEDDEEELLEEDDE